MERVRLNQFGEDVSAFFFSLRGLCSGFIGNSLEFLSRETIKTFL